MANEQTTKNSSKKLKATTKLKKIKLKDIKPYENNPRQNEETIKALIDCIHRYGYKVPIVVDENDVILSGHARKAALDQLLKPSDMIKCVVALNLTDEQKRKFRLADNKIAELSRWDSELLVSEMRTILDIEEMSKFGFKEREIEQIIDGISAASGGFSITEKQAEKAHTKLEEKFAKLSEKVHKDYIEVECELCGDVFFLSKKELKKVHNYVNL